MQNPNVENDSKHKQHINTEAPHWRCSKPQELTTMGLKKISVDIQKWFAAEFSVE